MISAGPLDRRKETDPTDPEVPDAKRRRALRRKHALVIGATVVVVLVLGVGVLIFKIGRQLAATAEAKGGEVAEHVREARGGGPSSTVLLATPAVSGMTPAGSETVLLRRDASPAADERSDPAADERSDRGHDGGGGSRAKASDIIRRPSF